MANIVRRPLTQKERSLVELLAGQKVHNTVVKLYNGRYMKPVCDPEVTKTVRKFSEKLAKARGNQDPFDVAEGFLHSFRCPELPFNK